MTRDRRITWIAVLVLAAGLLFPAGAFGADFDYSQFNREVSLRLAYGKTNRKADVRFISFFPRWGIFLRQPGQSSFGGIGLSFLVEGVISIATAEEAGWEFGFTPLLKIYFPLGRKAMLFIDGGAGIIWENINSPALAHTFNFTPQVGGGVDLALGPKLALTLAYRFRHSSNAGIYEENPAFDVNFFQLGLTFFY